MTTVLIVIGIVLFLSILLLVGAYLFRKKIPLPDGEVLYADAAESPGEILESKVIPLVGKPDYILKRGSDIIPVEVKTGKTPQTPYKNHIAQLFAYCLLVEEHFGKRPPYGIIRYPDKEFPLEFPRQAEEGIKQTIHEMLEKKQSGAYRDQIGQTCLKCRQGTHT